MINAPQAKIAVNIEDEMKRSYMDYAMSVIIGRALPDVRDGLKPVHSCASTRSSLGMPLSVVSVSLSNWQLNSCWQAPGETNSPPTSPLYSSRT